MKGFIRYFVAIAIGLSPLTLVSTSGAVQAPVPTCIVSLSPTATETLFAIGAGSQVQAVDKDANYPKHGLPTKRINALSPNAESIAGICSTKNGHSTKPDLVIISYNANSIAEHLTALGIDVVEQDAATSVATALSQITTLGKLTGHVKKADAIAASLQATITKDIRSVPAHSSKKLTVYYELDPTLYSLASSTFVGALLKSLGVVNVADAQSSAADAGYPQLSREYLVGANPKLVFLADTICCSVNAKNFAKRSGFSTMSAVKYGHIVGLSDDIASRWGPRLGILMNDLTRGVKSALNDARLWKS